MPDELLQKPTHQISLRITQPTLPDNEPAQPGKFNRSPVVSLLIDGKPISGFFKALTFSYDAEDMCPKLTVTFVPTEIALDVQCEGEVELNRLQIGPTQPQPTSSTPRPFTEEEQAMVARYLQVFRKQP
jgi:hypothetical protein